MTHAAFWAGVFPGHGKRCAGALRSVPREQYEHFGIFLVRCDTCAFSQLAGVSVSAADPCVMWVDWTESLGPVRGVHQRKSGISESGAGRVVG